MAIRLVRESSETPNITNRDDVKTFNYLYGSKDGIVKGIGEELSAMHEGSTFRIGSGRVVIQGWEIDIDENGYAMDFSSVVGEQFHSVYLELNLQTETASFKSSYSLDDYPSVEYGDNLIENPYGTCRLYMFRVQAKNGSIVTSFTREVGYVPNVGQLTKDLIDGNLIVHHSRLADHARSSDNASRADDAMALKISKIDNTFYPGADGIIDVTAGGEGMYYVEFDTYSLDTPDLQVDGGGSDVVGVFFTGKVRAGSASAIVYYDNLSPPESWTLKRLIRGLGKDGKLTISIPDFSYEYANSMISKKYVLVKAVKLTNFID